LRGLRRLGANTRQHRRRGNRDEQEAAAHDNVLFT